MVEDGIFLTLESRKVGNSIYWFITSKIPNRELQLNTYNKLTVKFIHGSKNDK